MSSPPKNKDKKERYCLRGLKIKEEGDTFLVEGLIATTHPDRVNDVLSKGALIQMTEMINDESTTGGKDGSFRSVSLFHDWIHENDPTLDEAAFLQPTAELVELDDGHHGVQVTAEINKFYKGDMTPEEIKYRVDKGQIAGFSIEYNTDESHSSEVDYNGESYRFIDELTKFGGVGFARARLIANPHAVIYKEISAKAIKRVKEDINMAEEEAPKEEVKEEEAAPEAPAEEAPPEEPKPEEKEKKTEPRKFTVKEILESKEFKDEIERQLEAKTKVAKEAIKVDTPTPQISLTVKEMKESMKAIKPGEIFGYKEAAIKYLHEKPEIDMQLKTTGIPLKTTLQTKCVNDTHKLGMGKMVIVNSFETKATLDTGTNTTTYTQNTVELADLYVPVILDIFNTQANLFGALPKQDHLDGSNKFGWRNRTSKDSSLSVDPDITAVSKTTVSKWKFQTDIKVYRVGISVTDYMQFFSRGSVGDLFMRDAELKMRDLMRDINNDLFTEQADGTTKVAGLEAVADSAGNTTLYGYTRSSTTNMLSPVTASTTYFLHPRALHETVLRTIARSNEVEGSLRGNLRYVCNPLQRDKIFGLEDTKIRLVNDPKFGFFGAPSWDGIPIIVDSSCQTDAIFCVDFEVEKIVIGKGPQMVGLAKVGAAQEAYIEIYLAHVYMNPLRISMVNTLPT